MVSTELVRYALQGISCWAVVDGAGDGVAVEAVVVGRREGPQRADAASHAGHQQPQDVHAHW